MENRNTPLWDASLDIGERLDWLLEALNLDEKCRMLSTLTPEVARLGIRSTYLGEEAAHGVEAKHDRSVNWGAPKPTTTFPQPFGMSQTWDTELMEKIGEAVGNEARILYYREGEHGGLCRWAPMAEPERDPRFGRTEEGYGEDPYLGGRMASSYIRGMRGNDPNYIKTAATLKYFTGYNSEERPLQVSIDPRSFYEYYLEPYRKCITEGGAEGVMTASSMINGVPSLFCDQLQEVLRNEWRFRGHIVGNECSLAELCQDERFADIAKTAALAVKAGVDCFADEPGYVAGAVRSAYDRGLLTMQDINQAVRRSFATRIRLGMFNKKEDDPFANPDESLLGGSVHANLSRQAGRESIVLLKNEDHILPLDPKKEEKIAVIGPLANEWLKDWNGGIPPYRVTPYDGIREAFAPGTVTYTDGKRRLCLRCGERYVCLTQEGRLALGSRSEAEEFVITDWGQSKMNLQAASTGCYLTSVDEDGKLFASRREAFGRYVKECFCVEMQSDGRFRLTTWRGRDVYWDSEGMLRAATDEQVGIGWPGENRALFGIEQTWDGTARAVTLATEADKVIVVLGTNPVINGQIGQDREQYALAKAQLELFAAVKNANPQAIVIVVSNYPHDLSALQEAKAILFSPSGCQELGHAIADVLSGAYNPSGRLNMTWYPSFESLPAKNECDIIRTRQTYQYYRGEKQYPFGYGLSYTSFSYDIFAVEQEKEQLKAVLCVRNTGDRDGAQIVQIYAAKEESTLTLPDKKLVGFAFVMLHAGEAKEVTIRIPFRELMIYDVITESMMLADGSYRIWIGENADTPVQIVDRDGTKRPAEAVVCLDGDIRMRRDFANITGAWLYDECRNVRIARREGAQVVSVNNKTQEAMMEYTMGDNDSLGSELHLKLYAAEGSKLKITINDKDSQMFALNTQGTMQEVCINLSEEMAMWGYVDEIIKLKLSMKGVMGISYFWFEQ